MNNNQLNNNQVNNIPVNNNQNNYIPPNSGLNNQSNYIPANNGQVMNNVPVNNGNVMSSQMNKTPVNNGTVVVDTGVGLKDGHHSCPNCGSGEIQFNQEVGKLYCRFCRSTFDGKSLQGFENNLDNLQGNIIGSGAKNINKNIDDIMTLKCNGCGAEIVVDTKTTTQAKCHWCKSILSLNSRIENGTVPDAILPFMVSKQDAYNKMLEFAEKRKFFAKPIDLTLDNVSGVYFPYLLVDVKAKCDFTGEGEHLVRRYRVDDHTYYDADLYMVRRQFDLVVDDLSVESNKDRLNKLSEDKTNNIINAIMPFDTNNCITFESNYLVGFTSEKRDVNIPEMARNVNTKVVDVARHALNQDLRFYDRGVCWNNEMVKIEGSQWVSAYLPVWLYSHCEIKDGKKLIHYIAVNARSKEIMGSIPVNTSKLLLISFIVELISIFFVFVVLPEIHFIVYLLALASGFIYYTCIYSRYRNKNARHSYEKETANKISNINRQDVYVKRRKHLNNSQIVGKNNERVKGDIVKKI